MASRDNRGFDRLAWLDRSGSPKGSLPSSGKFVSIRISPDSRKVIATRMDSHTGLASIWIGDLTRGVLTQIEMEQEDYQPAIWSPDGARIAFSTGSMRHPPTLQSMNLSSTGLPEPLLAPGAIQRAEDWSPNGGTILYFASFSESGPGLWALDVKGGSKPRKVLSVPDAVNYTSAQFSPDGHWIAYCGTESM